MSFPVSPASLHFFPPWTFLKALRESFFPFLAFALFFVFLFFHLHFALSFSFFSSSSALCPLFFLLAGSRFFEQTIFREPACWLSIIFLIGETDPDLSCMHPNQLFLVVRSCFLRGLFLRFCEKEFFVFLSLHFFLFFFFSSALAPF